MHLMFTLCRNLQQKRLAGGLWRSERLTVEFGCCYGGGFEWNFCFQRLCQRAADLPGWMCCGLGALSPWLPDFGGGIAIAFGRRLAENDGGCQRVGP